MSKSEPPSSSTLSQTLGQLIADTRLASLPPAVVERAKVSLLHTLCVGLIGRPRERVAHRMAERHWTLPAESSLLHGGGRVSAEGATFANTALLAPEMGAPLSAVERLIEAVANFDRAPDIRELIASALAASSLGR